MNALQPRQIESIVLAFRTGSFFSCKRILDQFHFAGIPQRELRSLLEAKREARDHFGILDGADDEFAL